MSDYDDSDLPPAYLHAEVDGTPVPSDDEIDSVAVRNEAGENGYEIDSESPIAWLNSARIAVDRDHDEVSLMISVGDPRGAIAMSVRKTPDGRLLLSVPHADDSMAHVEMTELHPGTYQLGD